MIREVAKIHKQKAKLRAVLFIILAKRKRRAGSSFLSHSGIKVQSTTTIYLWNYGWLPLKGFNYSKPRKIASDYLIGYRWKGDCNLTCNLYSFICLYQGFWWYIDIQSFEIEYYKNMAYIYIYRQLLRLYTHTHTPLHGYKYINWWDSKEQNILFRYKHEKSLLDIVASLRGEKCISWGTFRVLWFCSNKRCDINMLYSFLKSFFTSLVSAKKWKRQ